MSLERELQQRSGSKCELCGSEENLSEYAVSDIKENGLKTVLYACKTCTEQMNDADSIDPNHWRCLNDSMWSEHDAVKIMAWRMLNRIKADWTQDLLGMMYMEEDILELAKASGDGEDDENKLIHRDVNGVILEHGDSVVLIKDLKVKGSSMVAKQGTAVRNIRLDHENETYIEGRVDGQQIVIITEYVKKT
ncbi:alkylphosphonate utilization operon protein PhnA [Winogradskyella eximia]|uniref:Alkylphosphonate utilization operon protein PhnA n=1 Tax=Winogradskyella eximia TaxID=262006 RepID=A0A3D9HB90_9FLAO|nr:alkylphosphonate utilization protein [Winogradskyella eximia]RED46747.1 alkylphosphonate utilization operon protein PhnA [Winogradskyella eximia]|tara:strand:+ start:1561 stop:2136 length:576 start_codon:yes stop_codon:yes gene_type:complete